MIRKLKADNGGWVVGNDGDPASPPFENDWGNVNVVAFAVDEPVFAALAAAVQVVFDGEPGDDFPREYAGAADELWQFFGEAGAPLTDDDYRRARADMPEKVE